MLVFVLAGVLLLTVSAHAGAPNENFITRETPKTPDQVRASIKSYVAAKKWQYVGDYTLKKGQVLQVLVCVPEFGKSLWAAGMHVSAMAPCGHIGIWQAGGVTHVSMLHPRFLNVLYPDPGLQSMGEQLLPLLTEMLDQAVRANSAS